MDSPERTEAVMEAPAIPMPAKVAAAIAAIMGEVPKLGKGERNQHGNYNFTSIDDFLEAVRPLCAKHGLIIAQDEESFEIRDVWLLMRFRFTLAHVSGETWGHRPTRTIMVSSKMGSQAFGAAQSYVLKQFERSLFQIATGEKDQDADAHPPADLPDVKGTTPKVKPRQASPTVSEADGWKLRADNIKKQIDTAADIEGVDLVITNGGASLTEIKEKSQTAYDFLMDRATKRKAALMQKAA